MLKKIFSQILILAIIVGFFPVPTTHAYLAVSSFQINGVNSGDIYLNPGDTFSLTVFGSNDLWGDTDLGMEIENVRVKVDFTNNSDFNYSGTDQKAQVNGVDTFTSIPASDYSSSSGLDTPISNASVPAGNFLMLIRKSNDFSAFSISQAIKNYSNPASVRFEAQKVSDGSSVIGNTSTKTIFVNVKPHIIDKYFEKSGSKTTSIQTNAVETVDLVVRVKDYNGCSNIDQSNVSVDLSLLGLSSNESLVYDSCEGDGITANFKKTAISTLVSPQSINFSYNDFSVTDEDGNVHNPQDSNFVESGETDSLSLTVEAPGVPEVTNLSISDEFIGGPSKQTTTLSFSSNQSGTSKVALDSCAQADPSKIIEDTSSYSGATTKNVVVNSSLLNEGTNSIFACVDNGVGGVGSYNYTIVKDVTSPSISGLNFSANLTLSDANINYVCSEDGEFKIDVTNSGGTQQAIPYTQTTANEENSSSVSNALLELGANDITVYCRDKAYNEVTQTGSINKVPPTPSMVGELLSFEDNDIDNNGLNGIDVKIDWNSSIGSSFSHFESWRVFLLPSTTLLDTSSHNYIAIIADSGSGSFVGTESLTTDSAGDTLVNGGAYKAYVAIMGSSGELGAPGESSVVTLVADTIEQATVSRAEFINDTQLKIYTDTTLDTDISSHDASLMSFSAGGTQNVLSIDSVSGQDIIVNIGSLANTAITGTNLSIDAGSLHSAAGGFNEDITGIDIDDRQLPLITSFTNNSTAAAGIYYDDSIDLSWNSSENLASGDTYISFTRVSGNLDATVHKAYITHPASLAAGSQSQVVKLDANTNSNEVTLHCGTIYKVDFVGKDAAGNETTQMLASNIGFDNCAPATPTLNELTLEGSSDVTLSWNAALDDAGNGSGIRDYTIEIFSGNSCQTPLNTLTGITTNSETVNLVNGTYSWNLKAIDNIGHESDVSACDDFEVNSNIPTFSAESITDTVLGNSSYAKDGNAIEVSLGITNTDSNNITANLSFLTGNPADTAVSCASPVAGVTCSYNGTTASYGFVLGYNGSIQEGVRQVDVIAANTSSINERNILISTTVDVNPPSVSSDAVTYPNGGETIGGESVNVTWNSSKVSDIVGLESVELRYLKGGIDQGVICSGANTGSCEWDISSLSSDSDYSIELRAVDFVGNVSSDSSDSNFTLDRNAPDVPNNTIISPNGGDIFKGGSNIDITWNNASITDAGGLSVNPITLEYSIDNGSSFTEIAANEGNTGVFGWTLPSLNVSQALVRLTATDNVGNSSSDSSNNTFIIDSIAPSLVIDFAGNGGNTPQNGKFINNSGIQLTLTSSDNYMKSVYYTFENKNDNTFWDGSTYTGSVIDNSLCEDAALLGTDNSCDTIATNISPTIVHGTDYRLTLFALDEAGNLTSSIFIDYTGDIVDPTVAISTNDGNFVSNTIDIMGTAGDIDSGISSVYIQIKKGSEYWNGTSFVNNIESLLTSTSDNYANWQYDFAPPLGDTDGQSYDINVIAYDSTFRENNSTSAQISLVKDAAAPLIASDILSSPLSGKIFSGGDNIVINWNAAGISDGISGLNSNPIKLEYFDGATYQLIAENLENTGSYTWNSIPLVDVSNARIRLTASDKVGNQSFQNGNIFSIDSTNPSISSVVAIENNISNGKINALRVNFSENIDDSSINVGDFSVDGGSIVLTGFSTGFSTDDDEIILLFNETGDTGDTPTLRYVGTSLSDLAGRKLQNTLTLNSADGATPRVESIEIFDVNDNGKLDRIEVAFSENISWTTSVSGWNIGNALSGMGIDSLSVSSNVINLSLVESDNFDTSSDGLLLNLSSSIYTDLAGNSTENFSNRVMSDKAEPIKISTQTLDVDDDYKADSIVLDFSEDIVGLVSGEWNIGNLSNGASVSSISSTNKQINIQLNETSDDNDTSNAFTVEYTGTSLADGSGNTVGLIALHTSDDMIAPKILSRETVDSDGNGKIDGIVIETSEDLNDNFSAASISVDGYTVESYESGIVGDTFFTIQIEEKSVSDTSLTPSVRIVSNSSLGDADGNIISDEINGVVSTDNAGPIIVSARYDEVGPGAGDDVIYVTFGEDISATSIDTSVGGTQNDFSVSSGGAFSAASTTTIVSANEVKITLGSGAAALTAGVSQIGIASGALTDGNGIVSPNISANNRVIVSASVIINEVMFSSDIGNQYIELKNLGNSSVDITGWVIENAGWNGADITLPTGSISGNGFYLIARTAASSSVLNVTPDFIAAGLDLNSLSQGNLVLKDSNTVYDTVLAQPWPAGDSSVPQSMERKMSAGDGTLASSWYTAETSSNFDNTAVKGTPGIENVFDGFAPTMDSYFPAQNDLLPTAGHIRFDYSDAGVGVNSTTANIVLQKWDTSSYGADISSVDIVSEDVDNARAIYVLSDLDAGRYRAQFSIDDNAGNTLNHEIVFYIDSLSFKVVGGDIALGDISPGINEFSGDELVLEVTTIGAGFNISQNKSGVFTQGIENISDYDGNYGFGFDLYKNENGNVNNYLNDIQVIAGGDIANVSKEISLDGVPKTYTYKVRFGVKSGGMQSPGRYSTDITYLMSPIY